MKSYTDLEQSRKLAEILPIESADAFYPWRELMKDYDSIYVPEKMLMSDIEEDDILAWSLAALLSVLPKLHKLQHSEEGYYCSLANYKYITEAYNNPVDACYEMILKLHELNLL